MGTRDAVGQALADWAWANDHNDMDLLAGILTEDATFSVAITGTVVVGPIEGRDAIVAFIGEAVGGQDGRRRHCVSNVRDGDDFTAYLTILETVDGEARLVASGVYRGRMAGGRLASLAIELDRPF